MGAWDYVSTLTLDTNGYDQQINSAVASTKKLKTQTEQTDKALQQLERDGGKTQTVFQNMARQMGMTKEKQLQLGTAINAGTKLLGVAGVAIGTAIAAYKGYQKIMNSVGTTQRELTAKQESYNAVVDGFWVALNKGDVSGFIGKCKEIKNAAYEATKQLQLLTLADPTLKLQEKSFEYQKATLERQLKSTTDPTQQQEILSQLKTLVNDYKAFWNVVQKENQEGLNKLIKSNRATLGNMGLETVTAKKLNGTWKAGYNNSHKIETSTYTPKINEDNVRKLIIDYLDDYEKMVDILDNSVNDWERALNKVKETGTLVESGYTDGYGTWTRTKVRVNYDQQAIDEYVAMRTIAEMSEDQRAELTRLNDGVFEVGVKFQNETRGLEDLQREIEENRIQRETEANEKAQRQAEEQLKLQQQQKDELKSLFNRLGKPSTVSGISNYDRQLVEAINNLSESQVESAESIYLNFENAISILEQQLSKGDITTDAYNREVKNLQQSMLVDLNNISAELYTIVDYVLKQKPQSTKETTTTSDSTFAGQAWELEQHMLKMTAERLGFATQFSLSDMSLNDIKTALKNSNPNQSAASLTRSMIKPDRTGNVSDDTWDLGKDLKLETASFDVSWGRLTEFTKQYEAMYGRWKEYSAAMKDTEQYKSADAAMQNNIRLMNSALDVYKGHQDMIDELKFKYEELAKSIGEYANVFSTVGAIFSNLGSVFDEDTNKWLKFTGTVFDGISQLIPQIAKLVVANEAEAMASGTASAAKVPFPGNIAAILSVIATITSVIASIPKFAGGGVFEGMTSMGDFNLARVNNGEMILNGSQQSRLFRMLNSGNPDHIQNVSGDVKFKIQGAELVGVLNNYNKIHNRVR